MVLRDVLRKKQDAKKCLTKLDTLVKLRVARQNTAKGRGRIVSCNEMLHFSSQIGKFAYYIVSIISSLWKDIRTSNCCTVLCICNAFLHSSNN